MTPAVTIMDNTGKAIFFSCGTNLGLLKTLEQRVVSSVDKNLSEEHGVSMRRWKQLVPPKYW